MRNVFVIGPDKKIKLILVYPMTTGRNFDEVLRVIDSLQLTAKHKVATPVNWKQGEDVIIAGSVSDDEAKEIYPDGWKAPQALHPDRAAAALTVRQSSAGWFPASSAPTARSGGPSALGTCGALSRRLERPSTVPPEPVTRRSRRARAARGAAP